ncbi:MAG: glycosyltransferase [Candidatus Wallbacteria bacterium]|nr:glycosyltransferase [Candidatus Wallbacteria bacterium]
MDIRFSVIVPSIRPHALRRLLLSLSGKLDDCDELLVASDFPPDFRGIEPADGIKHIPAVRSGPAAARNACIGIARGTHFIFLDDDTVAAPELIKAYRRAFFNRPEACVAAGPVSFMLGHGSWGRYFASQPFTWKPSVADRSASTCNLAVRNEGVLFDERFSFAFEDVAFCTRFSDREWIFVKDAEVFHEYPRNLPAFCLKYFRYGRGLADFRRIYTSEGKKGIALPDTLRAYASSAAPADFVRFTGLEIMKYWAYYLGYVSGKVIYRRPVK